MGQPRDLAKAVGSRVAEAAKELSGALSGLSLVGISAAVLAAVALVGVTTDGLPVVVRNQPFAFATGIAVCVFIVAVSTVANVEGTTTTARVVRLSGVVLAGALASTVYMAAWGATEATPGRITVTFSGDTANLHYDAQVTAALLPSDDMLTVFVSTGTRAQLSSCGRLMPALADEQPRRGVEMDDGEVRARQATSEDEVASDPYGGDWMIVSRVGPDSTGTAVWSGSGVVDEGVSALCVKAVVPERCALGWTTDDGQCLVGSEAKESFWLIDLETAVTSLEIENVE